MIFMSSYVLLAKTAPVFAMKTTSCSSFILFYVNDRRGYCNERYMTYYAVLGVSVSSDEETVRKAFLNLVKKYHPDSDSPDANASKFHEIENAYRKLQEKFAAERWKTDEGSGEYGLYYKEKGEKEFDIKHTAPQHRQYLSYDGYGVGTPQQREKQYQKKRAQTAIENVYSHRISKISIGEEQSLVIKDKSEAKKIKIRSEMERLVEDLIQESISKGDFDNLSGSGKPLKKQDSNPYVDFVTQKMNEVLIENGFTPAWIILQKEIPQEINKLRDHLAERRMLLGSEPLSERESSKWNEELKIVNSRVEQLNKKINDFNLQVPLLDKQMMCFQLEKEASKILKTGKTKYDVPIPSTPKEQKNVTIDLTFVGILESFLFGKK